MRILSMMIAFLWMFFGGLEGCAHHEQPPTLEEDLADSTVWDQKSNLDLMIKDNWKLKRVAKMDSLMCLHAQPDQGRVFFDQVFWQNISEQNRLALQRCLLEQRNLNIDLEIQADRHMKVKVWTARVDDNVHRLTIGWLNNHCITCRITQGMVEYALEHKGDTLLIPHQVSEFEMWR